MTRLQSELRRLYFFSATLPGSTDAQRMVRAMVMELTRPPTWEVLAKVWHGVQAELELPAPAIAVSGTDGLQLWFSLEDPITAREAHAFLDCLRVRFLADVDLGRLRLIPASDSIAANQEVQARPVPAEQEQRDHWSAFVAPDLAPIFADTPWLDVAPSEEGQAALLRGLRSIKQTAFEDALKRLGPSARPPPAPANATASDVAGEDPRRFLMRVMNDDSVALALRIEAAKALLAAR